MEKTRKELSLSYGIRLIPSVGKRRDKTRGMFANSVVTSRGPEMDDIGIVSKSHDTGARDVGRKQVSRPEGLALFFGPCGLPVAGEAVHEDDASARLCLY